MFERLLYKYFRVLHQKTLISTFYVRFIVFALKKSARKKCFNLRVAIETPQSKMLMNEIPVGKQ